MYASEFIHKPFGRDNLLRTIRKVLDVGQTKALVSSA
jgi:hypothetical protein